MKAFAGLLLGLSLVFPASANAQTNSAPLCVQNQSGAELFFVLSVGEDQRTTQTLEHDQSLCLTPQMDNLKATVGVFETACAIEGCTRLAKAGQTHVLIDYVSFDNCTWLQE